MADEAALLKGPAALAAGKKNARRRHAWIVFEDESGVSQHPVVRRTWAPRGQTPVLQSRSRLSVTARVSIAASAATISRSYPWVQGGLSTQCALRQREPGSRTGVRAS